MSSLFFTIARPLCTLRWAFGFLFLLELLALWPTTGANLDAENPNVPPLSAYAPLVEILTPLSLVRTYKVNRSFFPSSPPSGPPENVPSFGNPTVVPAPVHLRENLNDADELWAKAAAETVAQWSELGRSLPNAKTFSGVLVDWSSVDCELSASLPSSPTAWVAFIPFSPASSTDRPSCSLRTHILAAQSLGAVAVVVYDDEGTGLSCSSPSATLLKETQGDEQSPVKSTQGDEELHEGNVGQEEIELGIATLRDSEAVRLLFDVLQEGKEWIVISVTTFLQDPDAVETTRQTEKTEYAENGNVFPSDQEPEQFTSREGHSMVSPLPPPTLEELRREREKKLRDGSFPDFIVAGGFNLLTSIAIVFSAFCLLQLLANTATSWPLQNRCVSLLLARFPYAALWFTAEEQMEVVDSDDDEDTKPERRNIHKLVLESFETRKYSSVLKKDTERFAGEIPPKVEINESEGCKPAELHAGSKHEHVPNCAKERNDESQRPEGISVAAFPLEEKRRPTCLSSPRLDQRRTFPAHRMVPASSSVVPSPLRSQSFSHPHNNSEQAVSGTNGNRPRAPPSLPMLAVQSSRSFTQPHISPFGQRGYACTGPCPICLDDYEDGQTIRRLPCGHEYHVLCIDPWLLHSASYCPMCKTDYLEWPLPKVPNDATSRVPRKLTNFIFALFEPRSETRPHPTQTNRRV